MAIQTIKIDEGNELIDTLKQVVPDGSPSSTSHQSYILKCRGQILGVGLREIYCPHFMGLIKAFKSSHGFHRVNYLCTLRRRYGQKWRARRKRCILWYCKLLWTYQRGLGLRSLCWKVQCSLFVLCTVLTSRQLCKSIILSMEKWVLSQGILCILILLKRWSGCETTKLWVKTGSPLLTWKRWPGSVDKYRNQQRTGTCAVWRCS